jgi:hypothetical protein
MSPWFFNGDFDPQIERLRTDRAQRLDRALHQGFDGPAAAAVVRAAHEASHHAGAQLAGNAQALDQGVRRVAGFRVVVLGFGADRADAGIEVNSQARSIVLEFSEVSRFRAIQLSGNGNLQGVHFQGSRIFQQLGRFPPQVADRVTVRAQSDGRGTGRSDEQGANRLEELASQHLGHDNWFKLAAGSAAGLPPASRLWADQSRSGPTLAGVASGDKAGPPSWPRQGA